MKWRNSKERELLSSGGSRESTLPNKGNPNPDLSDTKEDCDKKSETMDETDEFLSRRSLDDGHGDLPVDLKVKHSNPGSPCSVTGNDVQFQDGVQFQNTNGHLHPAMLYHSEDDLDSDSENEEINVS